MCILEAMFIELRFLGKTNWKNKGYKGAASGDCDVRQGQR
jgi:hypothetical protein